MTPTTLQNYTCKDLAQMAKQQGVPGWHAMRKEELVQALAKTPKRKLQRGESAKLQNSRRKNPSKVSATNGNRLTNGQSNGSDSSALISATSPAIREKLDMLQKQMDIAKNLGKQTKSRVIESDRLVVMVRDPYWLHAFWEISPKSVERARAALGHNWHVAKPVLRLYQLLECGTAKTVRVIEIHGGVNHWYIDVTNPPCEFRLEVGYLTPEGMFHCLARSNTVKTPSPNSSDSVDENWVDVAENADRIFAMSGGYSAQGTSLELQELLEERLRRPMGSPMQTRFGNGAVDTDDSELEFAIDAELVVYGVTQRNAHVTFNGEPVQLRGDGSFAVRLNLPERREVIPMVASSPNGYVQRTIILAVERNTKVLEPVYRENGE